MKQYIVHAWDGADEKALERRMNNRTAHFENARKLREAGQYVFGGAMLNQEGRMIGSTMVLQFETDEALQQWLDTEPYIISKAWERFELHPFRTADIDAFFK